MDRNTGYDRLNLPVLLRLLLLVIADATVAALARFLSIFLRFEFSFAAIPAKYYAGFQRELLPAIALTIIVFAVFRLYRSLWHYAGIDECLRIFAASLVSAIAGILLDKALGITMFRSYYAMSFMMMYLGVFAVRFSYRFGRWLRLNFMRRGASADGGNVRRVMVVGAGDSGSMIIREIERRPEAGLRVCCVIDDDAAKRDRYVHGIKVVGGRESIESAAAELGIDEIIIAIPSASPKTISGILEICGRTECSLKILPNLSQIIDNGSVHLSELRAVNVEDLLGREPVEYDLDIIMLNVRDKVVAVTGGGGSIGSELVRQLAAYEPGLLIVIDIYENNIYDLQQELKRERPELNAKYLVASVRDYRRIYEIFERYRPEIVYHAAAHKHVPLMEDSPNEAIKNNVFGTYNTARAAAETGVRRFVLISTDKAVNPTNIMGASKRICEMIVQMMNEEEKRKAERDGSGAKAGSEFVAVRFGNVLASNGSVVKLFEKQIACGGPVTVTHKDIVRYFMTIPEAVSLVLQAGAYARGGEIFVLDMGEPVKIDDLARNMIRLTGYVPDRDIKIVYTGLRPGEKLYEETLMAEEGLKQTPNRLIHIGRPIDMDYERFKGQLAGLEKACGDNAADIADLVREIVPAYTVSKELKRSGAKRY